LEQQISYIDIRPSSTTNLIVSTNSTGGFEWFYLIIR
jgi:hypothetical protein